MASQVKYDPAKVEFLQIASVNEMEEMATSFVH